VRLGDRDEGPEAVSDPKFQLRFVTVRGVRYLRIEDVAAFVRDLGGTEETDVRNRLDEAAAQLMHTVKP
jgi:hypothetical protein